jgi:ArsR family transcriptional regulator, arsenate/arsenite/antimonite-responsive transcriptional repressor
LLIKIIAGRKKPYLEEQAALFRVLGDPTRLKLLKLLTQQNEPDALCVNALAHRLGVTQPAVSQHLKILTNAGLVQGEKRGYRVHYFVKPEAFNMLKKVILQTLQFTEKQIGEIESDNK